MNMSEQFSELEKLQSELFQNLQAFGEPPASSSKEDSSTRLDVLARIEKVIQKIVQSLSRGEAPALELRTRSSLSNMTFDKSVGLLMSPNAKVTVLRSDCQRSVNRFALLLKVLSMIYKLVQTNSYATKRDMYYNDPQLFGSQLKLDSIVDDISCMLQVPRRSLHVLATSKGLISGDLIYMEEDGTRVECHSSSTAAPVSSNVSEITNIVSSAKFILVVEKDATFQRLLADEFCTRLHPCIIITGKGVPDVNSRLMVRKLWDTLHIPIFALVDADPYGIEIMCVYKYGSMSMAFEAHSLTTPTIQWMGLLPSDIESLGVKDGLIPFTKRDESKLMSLKQRPYISGQPAWERELLHQVKLAYKTLTLAYKAKKYGPAPFYLMAMVKARSAPRALPASSTARLIPPSLKIHIGIMMRRRQKAEIQSLASIAPHFLTRVYLPNKLRYGGWI